MNALASQFTGFCRAARMLYMVGTSRMAVNFVFLTYLLKKQREDNRERQNSYILVYSPPALKDMAKPKPKPGAGNNLHLPCE